MTFVLIWGAMFALNHCLLGSIFKKDNNEQKENNKDIQL